MAGKFQCIAQRGSHGKVRCVVGIQLDDVEDRILSNHPTLQRGEDRPILSAKDKVAIDAVQRSA